MKSSTKASESQSITEDWGNSVTAVEPARNGTFGEVGGGSVGLSMSLEASRSVFKVRAFETEFSGIGLAKIAFAIINNEIIEKPNITTTDQWFFISEREGMRDLWIGRITI